jgi:hypothetical protein
MFAALSTVIFQGFLPDNSESFLFIAYSVTSSLSFSFLFLCIVICIEIVTRSSKHMYEKASRHKKKVIDLIHTNQDIIRVMKNGNKTNTNCDEFLSKDIRTPSPQHKSKRHKSHNRSGSLNDSFDNNTSNNNSTSNIESSSSSSNPYESCQYILQDDNFTEQKKHIDNYYKNHYSRIKETLKERENVNEKEEDEVAFDLFWKVNCKEWGETASLFFYCGTSNLLLAIMLYMWSNFFIVYNSIAASIIAVSLIGSSLLISVTIPKLIAINSYQVKENFKKSDLEDNLSIINSKIKELEFKLDKKKSEGKKIKNEIKILNENKNNINNNVNPNGEMRPLQRSNTFDCNFPDQDALIASPRDEENDRSVIPNRSVGLNRSVSNLSSSSNVSDRSIGLTIDRDRGVSINSSSRFSTPSTNISTPSE